MGAVGAGPGLAAYAGTSYWTPWNWDIFFGLRGECGSAPQSLPDRLNMAGFPSQRDCKTMNESSNDI
jgi:hypothetical protein